MTEPGEAIMHRHDDSTITVERADDVIRVSTELVGGGVLEEDGTLVLDTARVYRYRFLRVESDHVHLYERIRP